MFKYSTFSSNPKPSSFSNINCKAALLLIVFSPSDSSSVTEFGQLSAKWSHSLTLKASYSISIHTNSGAGS